MQLTPRYGTDPVLTIDDEPGAILQPLVRQRRRLVDALTSFTDEQWNHPSRCDGWTNRDVVTHLDSTNAFWAFSIAMGTKGEPSQFLTTFDPVTSPAQLVADAPAASTGELLDQFATSNEALADRLGLLTTKEWSALAEAPLGHVAIDTLTHHALWDSLVHERDILLPLGLPVTVEPDEIDASLRFAAALSPAFALTRAAGGDGASVVIAPTDAAAFTVTATDHVAVSAGADGADLTLVGTAVDLLESLSLRAPLGQPVPDSLTWWFDGLKVTFDQ